MKHLLKVILAGVVAIMAPIGTTGCGTAGSHAGVEESQPESRGVVSLDNARFTVITPGCIRMEYSPTGQFVDEPSLFAVNRNVVDAEASVSTGENVLTIDTGQVVLTYRPDGKPFHEGNLKVRVTDSARVIDWAPGASQSGNLGGTIHTLDQVKRAVDLGEGLLSRDGWYLLDDSKRHLLVDGWVKPRPDTGGTDWYFFGYGDDYRGALQSFTAIGGRVPLPRKYVLGSWYSRWWKYSEDDYKQIVREYEENDFPLDIIVMDMEWHRKGWTGWSWNRELLPDAEDLLKWFHEQNLFVTLNIHPADGVAPHEDAYGQFMHDMGEDPASGRTIPFDAANEKYMKTLLRDTHTPLEKEGVDFWWLDWQQEPYTRSIPDLLNLTWLNHVYYVHSEQDGKRGLQFSRWGAWGDHRHPIHFSGDADTGWPMLSFEVSFTSTAGNVGCFFWSHDIGGHFGERNEEPYTRWVQFAATTAAMRLHSGIIEYLDRRPWKWDSWATESMRGAFHLRAQLMPYIYSSVWECYDQSVPLSRPMYLDYPENEAAYANPQEFLFGDNLLVAPIAAAGAGPGRVASQLVWFPEGDWYNWFTSERVEGDQSRIVNADIDEFPLYARAGVPVPMQHYSPRMTTEKLDELIVRCYPGADGETGRFTLYEDDGVTTQYESGRRATTELVYTRRGDTITVEAGPTDGSYDGQVEERSYIIDLPAMEKAESVIWNANGEFQGDATASYDDATKSIRIELPKRSIRDHVVITVRAVMADNDYLAERALKRRLAGVIGDSGLSLQEALSSPAAEDPDVARGLLGLAGAAMIENETAYPQPETVRQLFRNEDSLVDEGGFAVRYYTLLQPEGKVVHDISIAPGNVERTYRFDAPQFEPVDLPLYTSSEDYRVLSATVQGRKLESIVMLGRRHSFIKDWKYSGPFPFDPKEPIMDQVYLPQQTPADPQGKWLPISADANGVVKFHEVMPFEDKIAYALAVLPAAAQKSITLGFRSDDGIEVWFNGKKVHENNVLRGMDHEWEKVSVVLSPGDNILLLKISQANGDWQFSTIVMDATTAEN